MIKNSLILILVLITVVWAAVFSIHYVRAQQEPITDTITATVKIELCGDEVAEGSEECDRTDLKSQTCIGLGGYDGGDLSCTDNCTYDMSACTIGGVPLPAGGEVSRRAKIILQGKAYPSAKITVLKDGQIVNLITADSQANFRVQIINLTTGTYTFGLWAEDNQGRKSVTVTFTRSVTSGKTTIISGIFLPPTIEIEKNGLEKGEALNISGQTAPESEVSIFIDSGDVEIIKETKAETDGTWFYIFDTSVLEAGVYTLRAKATSLEGLLSSYSKVLRFYYIVEEIPEVVCPNADLNGDGRVSLVDFSILLYYWGTDNACCDQNQDWVVGLPDFSIMMYYWTG